MLWPLASSFLVRRTGGTTPGISNRCPQRAGTQELFYTAAGDTRLYWRKCKKQKREKKELPPSGIIAAKVIFTKKT